MTRAGRAFLKSISSSTFITSCRHAFIKVSKSSFVVFIPDALHTLMKLNQNHIGRGIATLVSNC